MMKNMIVFFENTKNNFIGLHATVAYANYRLTTPLKTATIKGFRAY